MVSLGLTSIEFIFLLPVVVVIYYLVPRRIKTYFLLLVNLFFYGSFGIKNISIVVLIASIIWMTALLYERTSPRVQPKLLLSISIAVITAILVFFKMGTKLNSTLVAPLGISFYSLQAISYIVDVYHERIKPEKNPLKLLMYLSFFPTITSGPIYRYRDFNEVYSNDVLDIKVDYYRITNGIVYMLWGYFLKLVIAERAAIPVNYVFENFVPDHYGGFVLSIIAITYSIQIYADFAGYSAIVIGIAQIMGFDIPENFSAPYMARSIKEFWRRWHISFSSWLKDYIYVPLGGNRDGRIRKYINIMITFLISGLWHGGGLHFLAWGAIHALYQIVGDVMKNGREEIRSSIGIIKDSWFHRFLNTIITFLLITIAWIFFRTGVKDAITLIITVVISPHIDYVISGRLWEIGLSPFGWIVIGIGVAIVLFGDTLTYRGIRIDKAIQSQGMLARCFFTIIISLMILILGVYGDQHDSSYFVYRDF